MSDIKKGQARVATRARLMLLLGDQLITDEVAALAELVKNSYDADATRVIVTLFHVSERDGYIIIRDNGHGMTREKVLSSWLELGTLSKARSADLKPRLSELRKRVCLGEKGLGRLAVHKLGWLTELVTKRIGENSETRLTLDWKVFEKSDGFLEEIPVEWEETEPRTFAQMESGTQISIRKLQRCWNQEMIEGAQRSLLALTSPFAEISDFDVIMNVEDKLASEKEIPDLKKLVGSATYSFVGEVDSKGQIEYEYKFERPDHPEISRRIVRKMDVRNPEQFLDQREPTCGPFKFKFYAWDLSAKDLKDVFGDSAIYRQIIRPNTGVKVYRDGFRVLPYGNMDNDWLGMDLGRVRQFERSLSRNQALGIVEISSSSNRRLLDKTDREGLIDNEEFNDFLSLVKSALTNFEAERYPDRRRLKELTGSLRSETKTRTVFSRNMAFLSETVLKSPKLDAETKLQIRNVMSDARNALDEMLADREEPLLVAASIGLTYMMPTHEVRRDIREARRILRSLRDSEKPSGDKIESATSLLKQADEIVAGIGRLMQKSGEDDSAELGKVVKTSVELMRYRFERNLVSCELDLRSAKIIKGGDRLITVMLLNFLDNSIYWLNRNKPEERKIKIIVDSYNNGSILVVSDSGPGFGDDDIGTVTLPFFTRKPNGMGLGLYIADRIAGMIGGRLAILDESDMAGLLSGANIAAIFPGVKVR